MVLELPNISLKHAKHSSKYLASKFHPYRLILNLETKKGQTMWIQTQRTEISVVWQFGNIYQWLTAMSINNQVRDTNFQLFSVFAALLDHHYPSWYLYSSPFQYSAVKKGRAKWYRTTWMLEPTHFVIVN